MNRNVAVVAGAGVLILSLGSCSNEPSAATKPASTTTVTAAAAATGTPTVTVTATPSQSTAGATPVAARGSTATFEHFRVTVQQVDYVSSSKALMKAEVCVRSLPPDPQGDRTRISWDPWSVTAGTRKADAGYRGDPPPQMFAPDSTYGVGQCAAGWIPFQAEGRLDTIRYDNGVGDEAVWDPDRLSQRPVTRHREEQPPAPSGIGEGTYIVGEDIQPGRYQASAGPDGYCYWARLQNDSGDIDSIIANNSTSGRASVTISSSDGAFETGGCTTWIRQ